MIPLVGTQIHVRQRQVLQTRQRHQQCYQELKGKLQFDLFHTFHPKHTIKGRPRFIRDIVPNFPNGIEIQPKRTEIRQEPQRPTYWHPQMCEPRDPVSRTILRAIDEAKAPHMGPKMLVQ